MATTETGKMVYKTTLRKEYGLSDQLIRLLGAPDKFVVNRHRKRGPRASLYSVHRVEAFMAEQAAAIEAERLKKAARRSPAEMLKARLEGLARRFPQRRDAVPMAARAMFNLNRYAKHRTCTAANRAEIYELKDRFVEVLYQLGYAVRVYHHELELPGKPCFGCDGSGDAFSDGGDITAENDFTCHRCGGTGWYRAPDVARFVCFEFTIDGDRYSWHQPKELVAFKYALVGIPPAEPWVPDHGKPIDLPKAKFPAAKALLRFVLGERVNGEGDS